MSMDINDIKINVKITNGKLKAIIALDFGEFLVKGFRVMESEYVNKRGEKLWLQPPSYKDASGKYHPIFYIPFKNRWEELEDKIWQAYDIANFNYHKKVHQLNDQEADELLR